MTAEELEVVVRDLVERVDRLEAALRPAQDVPELERMHREFVAMLRREDRREG